MTCKFRLADILRKRVIKKKELKSVVAALEQLDDQTECLDAEDLKELAKATMLHNSKVIVCESEAHDVIWLRVCLSQPIPASMVVWLMISSLLSSFW